MRSNNYGTKTSEVVKVGNKKPTPAIITIFAVLAVVIVSVIVIIVKSNSKVNTDGLYRITYYEKNGKDLTKEAQRGMTIDIDGDKCRMGGETKYDIEIKGSKVTMDNGHKKFTGTYDKKNKTFSIVGEDKDGNVIKIEFVYESDNIRGKDKTMK